MMMTISIIVLNIDDDDDDDDHHHHHHEYLVYVVRLFGVHQKGPVCGLVERGPPCYQHACLPNVAHEKYTYDDTSSISCTLGTLQILAEGLSSLVRK